ncbi:Glycosyl transferase [Marinobacter nitratireducens]|uniref:Glycosyl transferase n=1 Tax=Marinobacter nitratireducens TaxID=1137280 RepID=A0A072N5J4_9GAMM|nr:glycosyltransferase family 4 protein [Marinobacter nitratireducens]KEF32223.1 Glycosyl transferase [Marinobacter nitratireducens]
MSLTVTHIASGDLWAGAEVQVYQLIKALSETREINPTAIVFNHGVLANKLQSLGVPVTVADETSLSAYQMIQSIRCHIRSNGANVIHTHGFKENILGVTAQRLAGVRCSVRTVHGNPEHTRSWKKPVKRTLDGIDTLIGRWFQQGIVAVSKQLKELLERPYPGKTSLIHNFIDVQELSQEQHQPAEEKAGQVFTVGLVGRLVPVKRADLFIEALDLLRKRFGHNVRGVIIGDGPLRKSLEARTREHELDQHISFVGFLNPATPAIRQLDALLMPSDHEGLPMTLIEALALKIPVVAHDTGGIPEALDYGRCGTLVKEHSASGYAAALDRLIKQPADAQFKASAGESHVREHFDRRENVRKYIALYQSLT